MTKPYVRCINELRNTIDHFWKNAQVHGRCWGETRNGSNPLSGSHITIFDKDEIVSIYQPRGGGEIKMVQYRITDSTELGEKIKAFLDKQGIQL